MSENKLSSRECGNFARKESVIIDTNRILDSCKDKDCFEDVKVMLTECGQEVLEKCGSIRVVSTKVIWSDIVVDPVKFNKGFYQISIRFFTKITLEACVAPGRSQEIDGIAVTEKKVVLYGSEGNVNIFRSSRMQNEFCTWGSGGETVSSNKPSVVVEVVDPIALSVKVIEKGCGGCRCSCCGVDEVPTAVLNYINGNLCDPSMGNRGLYVSLGFFSVVRIERPSQFIISASEYSVPDKVCQAAEENDPCKLFAKMSFPVNEFSPPSRDIGSC